MVNKLERVDVFLILFIEDDLIVKMGTGTDAGVTHQSDNLPSFDSLTFFHFNAVQVTISSRVIYFLAFVLIKSKPVFDFNKTTKPTPTTGPGDHPVGRSKNRSSRSCRKINSSMEIRFMGDRMNPFSVPVGDSTCF